MLWPAVGKPPSLQGGNIIYGQALKNLFSWREFYRPLVTQEDRIQMKLIFHCGTDAPERKKCFLFAVASLCAMLHALSHFRMNQRRFQNFSNFLREELLAKVTYSVIPANPGSGPGQAPESRIARLSLASKSFARGSEYSPIAFLGFYIYFSPFTL